eukprot:Ihof_evm9s88 gene=Ihof_evmTU9s88
MAMLVWMPIIMSILLSSYTMAASQPNTDGSILNQSGSSGETGLIESNIPPMLFVSTLDGAMHAIDAQSGERLWTFGSTGPLVNNNLMTVKTLFFPDPTDGSLYYYDNDTLKRMQTTMQDLVEASPIRGVDGSMYIGSKKSKLFALDGLTGKLQHEFDSRTGGEGLSCPATPYTLFLGRVDYSVSMINEKGKATWNATYSLFTSAQPTRPGPSPAYIDRLFYSTDKGEVVARDIVSGKLIGWWAKYGGLDIWNVAYDSPVISIYMSNDGSLQRIPLLLGRHDTKNLWLGENSRKIAVNQYRDSLYCLPKPQDFFPTKGPSDRLKEPHAIPGRASPDKSLAVYSGCDPSAPTYPWCLVGVYDVNDNGRNYTNHNRHTSYQPMIDMDRKEITGTGLVTIGAVLATILISVITAIYLFRTYKKDTEGSGKSKKKKSKKKATQGESKETKVDTVVDGVFTIGKLKLYTEEVLGYGSQGTVVYKGSFEDRPVAVKRMLAEYYEIANHEVSLLLHSDSHSNVVRYFIKEHDNLFLYMALELCQATLVDIVENNYPTVLDHTNILQDIMRGIQHVHSLNIVHRDIKPVNVLLSSQNRIVISDFGLCKRLVEGQHSFATHVSGTQGWIAPETILKKRMTKAVDIFSAGCVFYYVLSGGKHPFDPTFERERNIRLNKSSLSAIESSIEAYDLISHMIEIQPEARPTATMVLNHPFFWSPAKRLSFLNDVSDILEAGSVILECDVTDIVGTDWHKRLDPLLLKDLRRFRSYQGDSIRDLLRCIRNKKHHYQELSPELKEVLGVLPNGYSNYF